MLLFLIPLVVGFAFNSVSAFTTYFSTRFGERVGRIACIILRDVLGIPVWVTGFALAILIPSPQLFAASLVTSVFAGLFILSGVVLITAGLIYLRWRAAAPALKDSLVVTGLYSRIRHPLYSGMLLELVGLFLWSPVLNMLIACFMASLWVVLQSRLEEADLLQRLPAYRDYMARVPRFIPKLRV